MVRTLDMQGRTLLEVESYTDSRLSVPGHTLWARTENTYDALGQLVSVRDTVAGVSRTFDYDSAGNMTRDGYEPGREYMYNVIGKLASVTEPDTDGAPDTDSSRRHRRA